MKSFLKNLIKTNKNKAQYCLENYKDTRNVRHETKTFVQWVVGVNSCRIFRLPDKWHVRQMKLFNFMNCRANETSDKLDVMVISF